MDIDSSSSSSSSSSSAKPIPDLESYINGYSGHTKLVRLQLIAQKCPALQEEALTLLGQAILSGVNTKVLAKYGDLLSPIVSKSWATGIDQSSVGIETKMTAEITAARASLSKQRIREAHNDFGEFHHRRGDITSALKQFTLARDHSSSPLEMGESSIKGIVAATDIKNMTQLESYLNKFEHGGCDSSLMMSQFTAARGLFWLMKGEFGQAARKFAEVSPEIGDSLTNLITAEDVATYGTLCAFASLEREEAKRILSDSSFRNFIDLVPAVGEMVTHFFEGRYGSVISWLQTHRTRLALDLYLSELIDRLFEAIRDRCVLQYVTPYLNVSLVSMAEAFSLDVPSMEHSVATLIGNGSLNARIDSAAKTIHVVSVERRAESFAKVAKLSSVYVHDMQSLLLRMSCLEQDVMVAAPHDPTADFHQNLSLGHGDGGFAQF
jgi:COP9 signalosome complex subunit 1